jgi:hypothetical protein
MCVDVRRDCCAFRGTEVGVNMRTVFIYEVLVVPCSIPHVLSVLVLLLQHKCALRVLSLITVIFQEVSKP